MLASLTVGLWMWIAGIAGPVPATDIYRLDDVGLGKAGLTLRWEANLPLALRDRVHTAFVIEDALYVMTAGGTVFALNADAGLIRWGLKLSDRDYTIYRPAHISAAADSDLVVMSTTKRTYIIERHSGEIVRSFEPPVTPGSSPVGIGRTIFMGSMDGNFYAFVWGSLRTTRLLRQWQVTISGPVTAAPTLHGGDKLVFASRGGTVYSCRAEDKAYRWSFRTGGAVLGDLALDGNDVYVANMERSVFKLNAATGELIWRRRLPSPLAEGPIVASGTVFQHCPGYGLVAIDAATGTEKWRHPSGRTLAAHMRQRDVVFTDERQLHVLDHETGKTLVRIDPYPAEHAVANGQNDAAYLLENSGHVVCLRPEGVPYLRSDEVNAIRARLNAPAPNKAVKTQPVAESDEAGVSPLNDDPLRSPRDLGP